MRGRLRRTFESKHWRGSDPGFRSGPGSTLAGTGRVRARLRAFLDAREVGTFLDAPCGDWRWMQQVELDGIDYIGADISLELVEENRARFSRPGVRFEHLDITSDPLPPADMMMCRDCLFHLKNRFRWAFLRNFAQGGIPLLLMTMHHMPANRALQETGKFAAFSPMAQPFGFPAPLAMIHETFDRLPEDWSGVEKPWKYRSLGLWTRDQVSEVVARKDGEAAPRAPVGA
jgi:SAM-dependent methyltransferase